MIERVASQLNAELPRAARRLYLYSDVDLLIPPAAVERHAAAARQIGVEDVRLELFKGSPHVSHMRSEPQRYFQVIKDLWNGRQG
jgi:alpha-beta hydrolase superfamily lysophospholipase